MGGTAEILSQAQTNPTNLLYGLRTGLPSEYIPLLIASEPLISLLLAMKNTL